MDILKGFPLPNCPYKTSTIPPNSSVLYNPAISTNHILLSITLGIYGILCLTSYNNLVIFNRKVLHPSVRNLEFGIGFLLVGLSCGIDSVRYSLGLANSIPKSLDEQHWIVGPSVIDSWLLLSSSILRGISILFITLGLNQQRLHRSSRSLILKLAAVSFSQRNQHNRISVASTDTGILPLAGNRFGLASVLDSPQFDAEFNAGESQALLQSPLDEFDQDFDEIEQEPRNVYISILNDLKTKIISMTYSLEFVLLFFAFFRILMITFEIDPTRLQDVDSISPKDSDGRWPVWIIISSLIQYFLLVGLAIFIAVKNYPGQQRGVRTRRQIGPSFLTKVSFLIGAILLLTFCLEPSIISRIVIETLPFWGDENLTFQGNLCSVPPWWWIDHQVMKSAYAVHGWASWVDVLQWLGFLGFMFIFSSVKAEFNRNRNDWVWVTVSEVQNTFDFRRY